MGRWARQAMVTGWLVCGVGCALQKAPPTTVLTTSDFIADSTTVPTTAAAPADANAAPPAVVTVAEVQEVSGAAAMRHPAESSPLAATDGMLNVTAEPGAPLTDPAAGAVEEPVMVDAKIGEINGRAIRAQQVLDELGPRLAAAARTRKLALDDWKMLTYPQNPPRGAEDKTITRDEWVFFAKVQALLLLNGELQTQLFAEEARASLKPNEQQGLKFLVQEFAENTRRQAGGQAALEGALRAKNQTEQDLRREQEARILIQYEMQRKLRQRIRTSWKDVRLYYEKHPEIYNPPPIANFRLITAPAERTEDIQKIQAALDAGEPFATVASMPENTYKRETGGRFSPQTFTGAYEEATFFSDAATNGAAQGLKPGGFTARPFDQGKDKAWLFLESVERKDRPLSDKDVQLEIANLLDERAMSELRRAYIERLKARASFTDLEVMAGRLAQIAAQRYWPEP